MGFFTSSKKTEKLPWIQMQSIDQLNEALENTDKFKLFFKHSTRCSISSMALNSFENNWTLEDGECTLYFIDLLSFRDVSNELEKRTGVVHQSPQAIVLNKDKVVYSASHSSISAEDIKKLVKSE